MASEPTLSSLAQLAASASATNILSVPSESTHTQDKTKEQLRRHYIRTLHKVVDEADVVLLVLDARDPAGCRSRLVEEEVRRREAEGKRLVFVLNKIGACAIFPL
jgi:nuclear GTP-binding protein